MKMISLSNNFKKEGTHLSSFIGYNPKNFQTFQFEFEFEQMAFLRLTSVVGGTSYFLVVLIVHYDIITRLLGDSFISICMVQS